MWNRAKSPGFIMRVHIIIYRECGGYQGGAIQPARTRFKPREFVQTGSAARK